LKVAIYTRIPTSDKDQNIGTQLLPLREFVISQGWEIFAEYQDSVPATDLAHRFQWQQLLTDAGKHKFDLLLVWRMDRAFRSVLDAATILERLWGWGIGLRSYSEPWLDTTSPFGEALYYITVTYAQLERGILRERAKAGTDRARKQGHNVGRPKVTDRRGFNANFVVMLERLKQGNISRHRAAQELGIGYATLKRLLDKEAITSSNDERGKSDKETI
jgi:DNA invertase Pin-like site-specific DNA recombinase